MKTTKKRFICCPKCGNYTRFELRNSKFAPLFMIAGGVGGYSYALKDNKRPPCKSCGYDDKNFEYIYLKTEINDKGKEVAYYTPCGERKII